MPSTSTRPSKMRRASLLSPVRSRERVSRAACAETATGEAAATGEAVRRRRPAKRRSLLRAKRSGGDQRGGDFGAPPRDRRRDDRPGFGCDSTAVINILTHRDSMQRPLIQQEYRTMYSEDLSNRISSELSGHHKKAMLLWILDPAGRDATVLREALSGDTIDLRAASEIICSRTPSQLQIMKQTYYAKFGTYLEHNIGQHTSGDHQKLLLAYVGIPRCEGPEVDPTIVTHDAKDLYKAGEKRLGTDEKTFIRIFTERSWAHLASVASAYHHMYDRSLEKVVKSEMSGNFELALLTILRCAENPAKYFAKVLRKSMKGLGTDDKTLIRVVVTRAEIDMQYIKAEYYKKYKRPLADAIHSETSGNYRTFLLSLVGGH